MRRGWTGRHEMPSVIGEGVRAFAPESPPPTSELRSVTRGIPATSKAQTQCRKPRLLNLAPSQNWSATVTLATTNSASNSEPWTPTKPAAAFASPS